MANPVGAIKDGVQTRNNMRAHRSQSNPQPCRIGHRRRPALLQRKEIVRLAIGLATLGAVCVRNLRGPEVHRGWLVGVQVPQEVPHGKHCLPLPILPDVGQ